MELITIKEGAEIVGKSLLTVRRLIYKAPEEVKGKDEKGRLLIDKNYLLSLYKKGTNEYNHDEQPTKEVNDKSLITLSNELQNKQRTIDSLNDRLSESNQIIEGQRQQIEGLNNTLLENNIKLIEASNSEPVIIEKEVIKEVPHIEERIVTVKTTDSTKLIGAVLFGVAISLGALILAIYTLKG